jgi:fatty acid desaturase
VANHNHQHCRTFISRRLNALYGIALSLAIGLPATAIIPMHNFNHHVHNNHPADFVRAGIVAFRCNLLNLLLFPLVALMRYAPVKARELAAWRHTRPHLFRQIWLERLAVYPVLLTLFVLRPLETALYFVIPQVFGQWGILAINHVQHDGCDPNSGLNHSRNFVGRWLNWWLLNNGFHTAHHARPGLHWSRLPEFHAKLSGRIDPALNRRSLAAALWEFYIWPARRPVLKGIGE